MNSFLKSALAAAVVAGISSAACADTFSLSGTFAAGSAPLDGGSFSGTYEFNGTTVGTFDVFLRNAGGTVLAEFSSANGDMGIYGPTGGNPDVYALFFSDPAYDKFLNLIVPSPFTGVGPVVTTGDSSSFATVDGLFSGIYSFVNSGASVAAVPEPATWGLMGLGLLAVGAARRRKAA